MLPRTFTYCKLDFGFEIKGLNAVTLYGMFISILNCNRVLNWPGKALTARFRSAMQAKIQALQNLLQNHTSRPKALLFPFLYTFKIQETSCKSYGDEENGRKSPMSTRDTSIENLTACVERQCCHTVDTLKKHHLSSRAVHQHFSAADIARVFACNLFSDIYDLDKSSVASEFKNRNSRNNYLAQVIFWFKSRLWSLGKHTRISKRPEIHQDSISNGHYSEWRRVIDTVGKLIVQGEDPDSEIHDSGSTAKL